MTRAELLRLVVGRARTNGFEFRRWYVTRLGLPWMNANNAFVELERQRRYYALLFCHEFAQTFWKPGEDITFSVPARSFERLGPDGTVQTVTRKPYVRRSARPDAWRYHLREMALAEDPLRYIRKYLHVADLQDVELDTEIAAGDAASEPGGVASNRRARQAVALKETPQHAGRPARGKPIARPLPTGLPAFLRRPPQTH